MKEESYSFIKDSEIYYYEFYSEGPNGKIRKVIQYQQFPSDEDLFSLGFGDVDDESKQLDDLAVSNNKDTKKILATVAKTVVAFLNEHPTAIIMAQGSTPSRTRLYQMGITQFWEEINEQFEVKGFINNDWYSFEKGKNFEAFFIFKK